MEEKNNSLDDPYDFVYNGLPKERSLLKEQPPSVKCGAKKIQYEFPTFCCMKGEMTLQPLDTPPEIDNLFMSEIVTILSRVLAPNLYVQTFRSLGNLGPLDMYRVELTASVKVDQRLYNCLTMSEEGVDIRELVDDDDDVAQYEEGTKEGVDIRELVDDDDDVAQDEEGTGKTFLYKALLATVRFRGLIALATASSGVVTNKLTGGRTAHSRFKIPINLTTNSICNIKKQCGLAKLLCQAKLIIWDEVSMAKRQAVEAVLPVVRRETQAQIVDSSLRMSPLGTIIKQMRLTINTRAQNDPWFLNFLLRVSDEVEEVNDQDYIRIPDDMTIPYTNETASEDALTNEIFPSFATNAHTSVDTVSRAILSTKNEHVYNINDTLIDRFLVKRKFTRVLMKRKTTRKTTILWNS
nr:hypothetical protein [Tanacetum cinerariifolium]